MPTALLEDGYRFYFYSNEHDPCHVHVAKGDGEARFTIEGEVTLDNSVGMKVSELARAQEIAERNVELIRSKRHDYFGK